MSKKLLTTGIILTLLMVFISSTVALAKPQPKEIDVSGLSLSEITSLFPASKAAEAALIHATPKMPFVVEGTAHQPEEVSLFDGQRLWYVFDSRGTLLAFTSPEELEAFVGLEYPRAEALEASMIAATSSVYARFYKDIDYSGGAIYVQPGLGLSSLGYFDNIISSARVDAGMEGAVLFDGEYFQGDAFWIPGGVRYYWLMAFDDMASSIIAFW